MPAAYDVTSRRFDDLMAEVCPGALEEVHARIDQIRAAWALIASVHRNRGKTLGEIIESGDGRVSISPLDR